MFPKKYTHTHVRSQRKCWHNIHTHMWVRTDRRLFTNASKFKDTLIWMSPHLGSSLLVLFYYHILFLLVVSIVVVLLKRFSLTHKRQPENICLAAWKNNCHNTRTLYHQYWLAYGVGTYVHPPACLPRMQGRMDVVILVVVGFLFQISSLVTYFAVVLVVFTDDKCVCYCYKLYVVIIIITVVDVVVAGVNWNDMYSFFYLCLFSWIFYIFCSLFLGYVLFSCCQTHEFTLFY